MSVTAYMDDLQTHIQRELSLAKREVLIAVAWISFDQYKQLFSTLSEQGVAIKVLCDDNPQNRAHEAAINSMRQSGIEIQLCLMPRKSNFMHHKFCIIDNETVLNGSFNWSSNAARSFENLLVIKDEPKVVTKFLLEFKKISALDQAAIRSLQALERCQAKGCDGRKINLMVFSEMPQQMTFELFGDLIRFCPVCGWDDFEVLQFAVQDTSLHGLLEGYELDEEIDKNQVDRDIDSHLTGYEVGNQIIHGIGFVRHQLIGRHVDDIHTKLIWKNKFVSAQIEDKYETDFGVNY